jgi:hypothetical protein
MRKSWAFDTPFERVKARRHQSEHGRLVACRHQGQGWPRKQFTHMINFMPTMLEVATEFATYRGSFIGPKPALENSGGRPA